MPQSQTPYQMIGGERVVASIVDRFYRFMDEPEYKELRALHAADLNPVKHGLTLYMTGWLGGPRDWFERGNCVVSLHRHFPISARIADQWADAMTRAIADEPGVDPVLAAKMAEALSHMAHGMVNLAGEVEGQMVGAVG